MKSNRKSMQDMAINSSWLPRWKAYFVGLEEGDSREGEIDLGWERRKNRKEEEAKDK